MPDARHPPVRLTLLWRVARADPWGLAVGAGLGGLAGASVTAWEVSGVYTLAPIRFVWRAPCLHAKLVPWSNQALEAVAFGET
jgi:hypothetical protein